ncbi:IclR family transcriptional regulator [Bacillus canaveralius]|uniref:IclR family transcriptional regulator n=1 Tax=Bacillus canaveralius TaxID=1403243 RepID=A0A2N5GGP2_9BACI|nr:MULTISPECIES: IclR family transcriptional regulator [Bacillus]PLR79927.1 IclR family transcriptional regulator [Bacillus canaveralius]PLR83511.1 IclR family transcriptional regulator [Bacillus sp. V33-4]PLR88436.1 IclR family transcriptional regulator [Bacillus canaveralius]RSK58174.1 IclR family transcriptional regulator [Bacillus canaveralius]
MSEVIRKSITLLTTIMPNEDKEEWSATEVSRELDIPIQTVHRLLSSLSEYGFVFKNKETKKFRLGLTLMQLGLSIRDNSLVRNSALPIMEKLRKRTNESVYLTVPEGYEGVIIDGVEMDLLLKVAEPIGMRTPLCVGASKKAILAHLKRKTRQRIIHELIGLGKIKDVKRLESELKEIKESKIAISFGESTEGTVSIASPIFSWEDKVVASISVGGPKARFNQQQIKFFMCETKKAAIEISEELGWINLDR